MQAPGQLAEMRIRLVWFYVSAACLLSPALANGSVKSNNGDHLVPIDGLLEPAYQTLLSRKLFVTSADFARIVILPSAASKGESAIAIYSSTIKSNKLALVTWTQAERNLWYAASDNEGILSRDTPVGISRSDANLPKSVARVVSNAVRQMLSRSRPASKANRVILDGTDIEISIDNLVNGPKKGLLTPYAQGKNAMSLRRLCKMLETYCKAKSVNRSPLLLKIQAEAERINESIE